eukprot:INCI6253.1.p1 GENE.INCI6253.1~~INCI6253.1.p1  ORF type:complete len:310 (+),score=68.92 INCI6253.1:98-1027(+)
MSTVLKSTTVKQTKKKGKFFEWLGLGVGTVVARTWKFGANKEHTLVLEHDCMTGRRQVYLDKKLVHNQTVFPDRSFEIFVQVDGKTGKVVVENKVLSLQVHYHFYYDGVEQVSRMFDSSCRNSLESVMKVSVPDIEVVDGVAQFVIEAASTRSTTKTRFSKRFSDFVELHQHVQAAFAGSHLAKSVPKPPPRRFRFWSNHNDPVFLEKRRAGLDDFLNGLIVLPRIASDQYVLDFFKPFFEASQRAVASSATAASGGGGGGAKKKKSPTRKKKGAKKVQEQKPKEDVELFDEEEVTAEEEQMVIDPDDI